MEVIERCVETERGNDAHGPEAHRAEREPNQALDRELSHASVASPEEEDRDIGEHVHDRQFLGAVHVYKEPLYVLHVARLARVEDGLDEATISNRVIERVLVVVE